MLRHDLLLLPVLRHHDSRPQQQRPTSSYSKWVSPSLGLYGTHCSGMDAGLLYSWRICNYLFSRFWFFKFLILVGITVGAFFIPDGSFHTGTNMLCWITVNAYICFSWVDTKLWLVCNSGTVACRYLFLVSLKKTNIFYEVKSISFICFLFTFQYGFTLEWLDPSSLSSSNLFSSSILPTPGTRCG